MFKGKVVAFALMLLFATSVVYAGDVDPCASLAGITCAHMKVNVCPFGDFQLIRDGCTGVGTQYMWITAKDAASNPIPGIPWTDYWLNSCNSSYSLYLCASPIAADSLTGTNGTTSFQGRIAAGGCNIPPGSLTSQGIFIAIQGKPVLAKPACTVALCLSIDILSPDLAGAGGLPDGFVDVTDLLILGSTYNCTYPGPYPPGKTFNACCDYTHDGATVDVSDFAAFGTHYQHKCQ
jgi:hypothetical protein